MPLAAYQKKRNFTKTPEPKGAINSAKAGGNSFVIQKHAARRLHYDFRLELDGVLKSWAVTRGPSLVPTEKRLAVHVEDHPLEYGDFEGTIPKGEYGGGAVIVWDRGTWEPIGDVHKAYRKGHLDFRLHGEKLVGEWHLVRMRGKPGERTENWLLIKAQDDAARDEKAPDILQQQPESVKTGRLIEEIAGEKPGWSSKTGKLTNGPTHNKVPFPKKARKADWPGFVAPALATLASVPPSGEKWLHEIKFDGYRVQAHIQNGKITMLTRSGLDWTKKFGAELPKALKKLPLKHAIMDGELVAEEQGKAPHFSTLQADLTEGRTNRFVLYLFDLLYLDGMDLRPAPLVERKRALELLLDAAPSALRYSEHFQEDGTLVLRHTCQMELEGIVSKQAGAAYESGRSKNWIKSKCSKRQEFVVAGFTLSSASKTAIGSLVLGYFEGGKLIYAGRVGTGFSRKVAHELFQNLSQHKSTKNPFQRKLTAMEARGVIFVTPQTVVEVEFQSWTADQNIRHASFRGIRDDKQPNEIIREDAGEIMPETSQLPNVKLTHPDRIYWEEAGITKQGLAEYYAQVWPRIEPFIINRPLALLRCPDGTAGQCFFQKHAWKGQSKEITLARDPKDDETLVVIESLPGLIGLVQAGTLEIHPWGSVLDNLEQPDYINMDLDPGPGIEWPQIIEAALEVRDRLSAVGLRSFVKTSGGKGLHVVAPLKPKAGWDEVKAFAKSIANAMAEDNSARYVATIAKAKRQGKILVDYLRNGRGATAVAPYSSRARTGAPVSMPLAWDELTTEIGPASFTVGNALQRLSQPDPWQDFWQAAKPLPAQ